MVRLVFRPYTQFRRSICTSESLRSSIRVSPDFDLTRHSSPSFGSQHLCSERACIHGLETRRLGSARVRHRPELHPPRAHGERAPSLSLRLSVLLRVNSMTRTHARLLGPCFKTGPASARNRIIADRDAHGQRLHGGDETATPRRRPHTGRTSTTAVGLRRA